MKKTRDFGFEQPGWRWGPFTLRLPFLHTGFAPSELLQGIVVAAATGFGLIPLLTGYFGLTFEEAVAASLVYGTLISLSWNLFGDPYAPGWITPALPFVLAFVVYGDLQTPTERFHAMAALSFDLAAILFVFGVTGLGAWVMRHMPRALKGGIIMGAAIAAFLSVMNLQQSDNNFVLQPIATTVAVVVCLVMTFSLPFQRLKARYASVALIASLGLLPGFLAGGLIGPLVGEVDYNIEWGILWPPLGSLWQKASPFAIGFPEFSLYLECLPLAFIAYIILFGDMITGDEVIREAQLERPDEHIDVNPTRLHYSVGIRNLVMAFIAPFFPTQGALWTGVHVIIVQRWREGREQMDSLFDGISAYYVYTLPFVYMFLPLVTGLKPLMGIALILTLVLTAFACAYVALAMVKNHIEEGVVLLTGTALAVFEPWQGLLVGLVASLLLLGYEKPEQEEASD